MKKTSHIVAQQAEKKPVTSERGKESKATKVARIAPYQWQPGQSGNPKGARKSDVARRIAKQIFENNEEEAYRQMSKALLKGNAYVFDVLAQRAYGKLKETHDFGGLDNIANLLIEGRKRVAARRQSTT